jgi:type II secretory pathway pseudopilin PulG
MSNVLIGIIGVILFIGLALAGALFLGPRFQESSSNSKASMAVQGVSQIASAIQLRNLTEGTSLPSSANLETALVTPGYMKAVPKNPSGNATVYIADVGGGQTSAPITFIIMPLDVNSQARAICAAAVRQTGMTTDGSIPSGTNGPTHPIGCTDNGGGLYTVYTRIG